MRNTYQKVKRACLSVTVCFAIWAAAMPALAQNQQSYGSFGLVNSGTSRWVKMGRLTLPQQGNNAFLRFHAGYGYNASVDQSAYLELFIRTSNADSVDVKGFCASAYAARFGPSGYNAFPSLKLVSDADGCSATAYDVYVQLGPYIGQGFYSVETSPSAGWSQTMTVGTDPGPGSRSVLVVPFMHYFNDPTTTIDLTHASATYMVVGGDSGSGTVYYDGNFHIETPSGPLWLNHDSANNVLIAYGGGVVSVGTTATSCPNSSVVCKLVVSGAIAAKEVVVTSAIGADYVFADDYKLASLSEVEQYVKSNHHLPGLPSAEKVEADGVNLAEMQSKLLAKIEELTLHMIDAEKRTKALEAEVMKLNRSGK